MLIFIDQKAPSEAKHTLSQMGEVVEFFATGITYDAVSGHPDVFFFQYPGGLIVAPNTPSRYIKILDKHKIRYQTGSKPVGFQYPDTAVYNALYTPFGLLHNPMVTDKTLKATTTNFIHCRQAYVRCTTLLAGEWFITSDKGIEQILLRKSLKVIYVYPQNIVLQGFENGFIGGTCGLWQKKIYFCGNLSGLDNADMVRERIHQQGFSIIELCNGTLFDVGSIIFIETNNL